MPDQRNRIYPGWLTRRLAERESAYLTTAPRLGRGRLTTWLAPITAVVTVGLLTPWYFGQFHGLLPSVWPVWPTTSLAILSAQLHNRPAYWMLSVSMSVLLGIALYTLVHYGGYLVLLRRPRKDLQVHFQMIALVTVALWVNAFFYRICPLFLLFGLAGDNMSTTARFLQNMSDDYHAPALLVEKAVIGVTVLALGLAVLQSASILERLGRKWWPMVAGALALLLLGGLVWFPVRGYVRQYDLLEQIEKSEPELWSVIAPDFCNGAGGEDLVRGMFGTHSPEGDLRMLSAVRTRRWESSGERECWDVQLPFTQVLTVEGLQIDLDAESPSSSGPTWAVEIPLSMEAMRLHPFPDQGDPGQVVTAGLEDLPDGTDWVVLKADANLNAGKILDAVRELRDEGIRRISLSAVPAASWDHFGRVLRIDTQKPDAAATLRLKQGTSRRQEEFYDHVPREWDVAIENPCIGDDISALRKRAWMREYQPPEEGSLPPSVTMEVLPVADYQDLIRLLDHALIGGADNVHIDVREEPVDGRSGDDEGNGDA